MTGRRGFAAALALGGILLLGGCGTVGRTEEGNLSSGKQLFVENCGSCHTLADAGTQSQIGPDLGESLRGKDTNYIRDGIVEPDKDIAEGFGPGIMPPNYGQTLDPTEIDALVDYLEKAANGS